MNIKLILLITALFFFLLVVNIVPAYGNEIAKTLTASYSLSSFVGTEYQVEGHKKNTYQEYSFYAATLHSNPAPSVHFWSEIALKKGTTNREIYLKSAGMNYHINSAFSLGYTFDEIGYGDRSLLFSFDVTNPFYDKNIIGNYQFTGIHFDYIVSPNYQVRGRFGGSKIHSVIGDLNFLFKKEFLNISSFFLYTSGDEDFSQRMILCGAEAEYHYGCFRSYSLCAQRHYETTNHHWWLRWLLLQEFSIDYHEHFRFGTQYFFSEKELQQWDWNIIALYGEWTPSPFCFRIITAYYDITCAEKRQYSAQCLYELKQGISLGFVMHYHDFLNTLDYCTYGLQAKITIPHL